MPYESAACNCGSIVGEKTGSHGGCAVLVRIPEPVPPNLFPRGVAMSRRLLAAAKSRRPDPGLHAGWSAGGKRAGGGRCPKSAGRRRPARTSSA